MTNPTGVIANLESVEEEKLGSSSSSIISENHPDGTGDVNFDTTGDVKIVGGETRRSPCSIIASNRGETGGETQMTNLTVPTADANFDSEALRSSCSTIDIAANHPDGTGETGSSIIPSNNLAFLSFLSPDGTGSSNNRVGLWDFERVASSSEMMNKLTNQFDRCLSDSEGVTTDALKNRSKGSLFMMTLPQIQNRRTLIRFPEVERRFHMFSREEQQSLDSASASSAVVVAMENEETKEKKMAGAVVVAKENEETKEENMTGAVVVAKEKKMTGAVVVSKEDTVDSLQASRRQYLLSCHEYKVHIKKIEEILPRSIDMEMKQLLESYIASAAAALKEYEASLGNNNSEYSCDMLMETLSVAKKEARETLSSALEKIIDKEKEEKKKKDDYLRSCHGYKLYIKKIEEILPRSIDMEMKELLESYIASAAAALKEYEASLGNNNSEYSCDMLMETLSVAKKEARETLSSALKKIMDKEKEEKKEKKKKDDYLLSCHDYKMLIKKIEEILPRSIDMEMKQLLETYIASAAAALKEYEASLGNNNSEYSCDMLMETLSVAKKEARETLSSALEKIMDKEKEEKKEKKDKDEYLLSLHDFKVHLQKVQDIVPRSINMEMKESLEGYIARATHSLEMCEATAGNKKSESSYYKLMGSLSAAKKEARATLSSALEKIMDKEKKEKKEQKKKDKKAREDKKKK
ncbi:PREDICTED: uncharacterized protein LOC104758858 [Camelina sativa]|uniref:Uncharacterized protein LOC104758858 n=1 Tax=Camelina sativa TaxID=90675 RepID=A0ABM0X3N6_CAMSA|nr:PREDICTED: uncharacterized protein LOC104758858 [Camelina sativa]XP_010480121.1 PREDICTED: uncharacterized protein LOC104758858 [Camelina sativa]